MRVVDVLQEPGNHRRRDHIGDALRDIAAVTLKSNADDLAILHYRSAAVAGIDLRADLDREVLVDGRMRVELKINPRHDSSGNRHPLAADRITIGRNGRFQRGDPAEFQRDHVFEKIRSRHRDQRQITIVG